MRAKWWARRWRAFAHATIYVLLAWHDARREDRLEMFGAIAIDVHQVFVGDAAQLAAQLAGDRSAVEPGVIAYDRLDRVDVVLDQFGWDLFEVRRVLDDPAQAFGCHRGRRITEGRSIALDVMGGAKQLFGGGIGKAVLEDRGVGGRQPVGLDNHPVLELAGEAGQRLFGARHGIIRILVVDAAQHFAQRIRLRDDV